MQKEPEENIDDIELQQAKAEVKRASMLRDALIRIVSHDIRGPMSNLKSVISLLREEQVSMEQAKEFLGTIDKGVDHTIQMLDELMEWGKAASADKNGEQEEIVIAEVINPILDRLRQHIEAKNLNLHVRGDLNLKCFFERNALKVVMRNLLSNAVKFTEKGGSISIDIHSDGKKVTIAIADTGIGIPEAMKEHLFEMKKDTKRPGTENEKSSGVGLFISRDLILQNEGTIDVEDNPAGKGTLFTFKLNEATK